MTSRKPRRSAEEILADKEAEIERLKIRAAQEAAKSVPEIQEVLERIEFLSKDLSVTRRGFVKGRQNFDSRIAAHKAWIAEIEAEKAVAAIRSGEIEAERNFYKGYLPKLISAHTNGDPLPEVPEYEIPENAVAVYEDAEKALIAAHDNRLALTSTKAKEASAAE